MPLWRQVSSDNRAGHLLSVTHRGKPRYCRYPWSANANVSAQNVFTHKDPIFARKESCGSDQTPDDACRVEHGRGPSCPLPSRIDECPIEERALRSDHIDESEVVDECANDGAEDLYLEHGS